MLTKKEGIINEIVYDNTVYYGGKYRIYPNIGDLKVLLKEIIQANATTGYVRITPFYVNEKTERQIEFDDFMFFIECMEELDEKIIEERISKCFRYTYYGNLIEDKDKWARILCPLCKNNDTESFKKYLEAYIVFLDELIPKLMDISRTEMKLKDEDLGFGYFCFEVHSE